MTDEQLYTNKENARMALEEAFEAYIKAGEVYGMSENEMMDEAALNLEVGALYYTVCGE